MKLGPPFGGPTTDIDPAVAGVGGAVDAAPGDALVGHLLGDLGVPLPALPRDLGDPVDLRTGTWTSTLSSMVAIVGVTFLLVVALCCQGLPGRAEANQIEASRGREGVGDTSC